jgi:hypothetical protein
MNPCSPIHLSFGYHFRTSVNAHWGVLSAWQALQLFGSPVLIVSAGEMKLNVWLGLRPRRSSRPS